VPHLADLWPFVATFAALVAAGIGFPIPEELPVVGAGIWVAANPEIGPIRWLILPVCIVGVVISDGLLYGVGRNFGDRLLKSRLGRHMVPEAKRAKIEENFHKHGVKVLLFARLLPGIRAPVFVMAGVMKLPLRRFILADGIYAIPGVSLLFFLAWWFGTSFQELIEKFEHGVQHYLKPLLILVGLGLVIAYLIYHFLKVPVSTGAPEEVPILGQVATMLEKECPDPNDPNGVKEPHGLERRRPGPLLHQRDGPAEESPPAPEGGEAGPSALSEPRP
jgi:membrane protein DedA with SNARE-associated domain